MNANKIAAADILDIIFDGRNKAYGAYQLRRSYNKRLATAVGSVLFFCLLLFFTSMMANRSSAESNTISGPDSLHLVSIVDPPPPPLPPPPPVPELRQLQTIHITPPIITRDDLVLDDQMPPFDDNARIDVVTHGGVPDDGTNVPPPEIGTGLASLSVAPKEDYDTVFNKVENPAEFPGGPDGWRRYLERTLQYPETAQENGIQGAVRVQFIVDKEGNISEVQALNDPGEGLANEAVRIIKKGPKWIPAEQNGRKVIFRHIQSITFQLQ